MNLQNEKGALAGALPVQHFAQRHSSRTRLQVARDVWDDAIKASGVDEFTAMALRAAMESYAKERVREEFAAFMAELNAGQEKAA